MGLQAAVCPALRAEWGSSSSSLYNVSMVSFPSPNPPSCCPQPRTLTTYFFSNNAWPVLQASALAGTHTRPQSRINRPGFDYKRCMITVIKLTCQIVFLTCTRGEWQHWKPVWLQVCRLTYPCPSLSAASQPVGHLRSSFCKMSDPSYDCQSHWHVSGPLPGSPTHLSHT